jgi:antirestriction protein ArdC
MNRKPSRKDPSKRELYADITAKIVAAIEAGAETCSLPWRVVSGPPENVASHRRYRGINTLLLWLTGHAEGYATPYWATFKQWRDLGHPVRKGETATTVIFWKPLDDRAAPDSERPDGDEEKSRRVLARAYAVFNAAQVDGFAAPEIQPLSEDERDARAEAFFARLPITVLHEDEKAFYRPATDTVHLPPFGRFKDANAYYSVRGHESVHATAAPWRVGRDISERFGSEGYAFEELIAELGAAFLCADLGLSAEPRPDHADYIASWLKVLRNDTRAVFVAAGKAQAAVDWLHRQQEAEAPNKPPE